MYGICPAAGRKERAVMKTRIMVKEGEYRLTKAGVMDARIDAEELYCFMNKCDKVILFLKKEEEVDKETEERYFELIERIASRIPLQHITGVQEFMGFQFKVGPDVLIPRQDTETLVEEAASTIREMGKDVEKKPLLSRLRKSEDIKVLDLCCGSGAIGISLSKICSDISVTAADISLPALQLAAENAAALRTDVEFLQGDLFEAIAQGKRILPGGRTGRGRGTKTRDFDMIVSNPPYIRTNSIAVLQEEVKAHEPLTALDGGRDGLDFYRRIVDRAWHWLKKDGWLLMEIGYDQGEDLRKIIKDNGNYTPAQVIKDLPGKDRVVKCRKK